MKKKILGTVLAGILACTMLTACGGPKGPEEVVQSYKEAMAKDAGYHVDVDMKFDISSKSGEMNFSMPITMNLKADVVGGELHGTSTMGMSLFGEDMTEKSEIYVKQDGKSYMTYTKSEDADDWYFTEGDSEGAMMASSFVDMDASRFAGANFTKTKDGYVVTQSFVDFTKAASGYDSLEEVYGGTAGMLGMDTEELEDAWSDAIVIYSFDKDCMLQSVETKGCEFSKHMTEDEDGMEGELSVALSLQFRFSDYGKVKAADVAVPDAVAENAVSMEDYDWESGWEEDEEDWLDEDADEDADFSSLSVE